MSYLIYNGEILAKTSETLKNGEPVLWSGIKADGELVNVAWAKASNAKKWAKVWGALPAEACGYASLLNSDGAYKRYYVTR